MDGIDHGTIAHFHANRIAVCDVICPWAVTIGSYPILLVVVIVTAAILVFRRRIQMARFLLVCIVFGLIVTEVTNMLVARPPLVPSSQFGLSRYSFPSTAVMMSGVVYLGIAFAMSKVASTAGGYGTAIARSLNVSSVLLPLLIGFSQIYLRRNFVSDVVGGLLGAAVVVLLSIHSFGDAGAGKGNAGLTPGAAAK